MFYSPTQKYTSFFLELLGSPVFSIPKGAQWLVIFDNLQGYIMPGIKLALEYDVALRTNNQWKIDSAVNALLRTKYQNTVGCVFCHGIGIPGESNTVNTRGIGVGSYLKTYVLDQRDAFPQMRMTFIDTNVSFADNFLRPWALSTATFGMIGRRREETKNYRTDIHCYKLGSINSGSVPSVIMHWTFFDACCISVSEEENNYNPANQPVMRGANFIYNSYSVDSEQNPFAYINEKK